MNPDGLTSPAAGATVTGPTLPEALRNHARQVAGVVGSLLSLFGDVAMDVTGGYRVALVVDDSAGSPAWALLVDGRDGRPQTRWTRADLERYATALLSGWLADLAADLGVLERGRVDLIQVAGERARALLQDLNSTMVSHGKDASGT